MILPRIGPVRDGALGWLSVPAIGLLTAWALVFAASRLTPEPARVDVDMQVSSGARVNLYINDLALQPRTLAVVPGRRHRYQFEGIIDDITMIRVDPTDDAGAVVEFFSLTVVGGQGPLATFGPTQLATWATDGIEVVDARADLLRVRTTTPNSIVTAGPRIPLPRRGGNWIRVFIQLQAADVGWRLAEFALIVLAVAGTVDPARRWYLPILAVVAAAVAGAAWVDVRLPDGPGSASVAVSRATYTGRSTWPGTVSTLLVVAVSLACGLFLPTRERDPHPEGAQARVPSRLRWWQVAGGLTLCALLTVPDLRGWAAGLAHQQFFSQWDSNNITYWSYLAHTGHLPLRDYWYPYAGFFLYDLPFPAGTVFRWAYQFVLLALLFLSLGLWQGAAVGSFAVAVAWMGDRTGLLPGTERYLLSTVLVLSYVAALTPGNQAFRRRLVPFWAACALALVFEPPQLIYAGVPIAAIVAVEVWSSGWRGLPVLHVLLRRLIGDMAVPAVLLLLWAAAAMATGQLPGAWAFYSRLGDAVAYSAFPTGFPEGWLPGVRRILVFIVGAAFAIAVGVYEARHGRDRRRYGYGLAAMGLVSVMVLQKHLVRWMDDQLLSFTAVTLIVLAAAWPRRRMPADYLVCGILLGAVAGVLALKPDARVLMQILGRSPSVVRANVALLASPGDLPASVNRERFSSARFATFPAEQRAVDVMRAASGPGGDVRAMALSDEPVVYILTGQPAVWMPNMYDASPIHRQARVVQWLRDERPPYLVFRRERLVFDDVPLVVRDPLVVQEAVATYAPLDVTGELMVLRRRQPQEPLPWTFWRDSLGATIALGHLARVSSYGPATGCEPSCGDLLQVSVPPGITQPITVPITVDGLGFEVTFQPDPSQQEYRILLDRLWFWGVARQLGVRPTVGPISVPGARAEQLTTRLMPDRLY